MLFLRSCSEITCPTLSCHKLGSWVSSDVWTIFSHKDTGSSPAWAKQSWPLLVSDLVSHAPRVWMRLSWDQVEQSVSAFSVTRVRLARLQSHKTQAPQLACYLVICVKKSYLCQLALGHVIPNFRVLSFCNLLPIILEDTHILHQLLSFSHAHQDKTRAFISRTVGIILDIL